MAMDSKRLQEVTARLVERQTKMDDRRIAEAIANHVLLSQLYREDTNKFEEERKRKIEALISSFSCPDMQAKLRMYQKSWDRILVPEFSVD